MKIKIICLLLSVFICSSAYSDVRVTMQKENGIYVIPCKLNGVQFKMYFDTGASLVSLSKTAAGQLRSLGKLNDTDIVGTARTSNADGGFSDNTLINIKDIEIAGLHLTNSKPHKMLLCYWDKVRYKN